jgi:hypothetical protein
MNVLEQQQPWQQQRQSAVTFAASVFLGSAFFLHWRYGGVAALFTLKALGFFAIGIFVVAFTLGMAFYSMHRSLMNWLPQFGTTALSPISASLLQVLGTALLVLEVVVGYLLTRIGFFWFYS